MWGPGMMGPWMMGQGWDGAGWWMLFMGVWNLLFWGAIIALAVWAIRRLTGAPEARHGGPVEIAQERYARGEISREQYEEIRQTIGAH